MLNEDKLRQLWFLLKKDRNKKKEAPLFYYDEHLTFFIRGSQVLDFLDTFLSQGKEQRDGHRKDFLAWKKFLEENTVTPTDNKVRAAMNKKIAEGIPEPIKMPWDIRNAQLVAKRMADFKGFKDPDSYPITVPVDVDGEDFLYVPVHFLLAGVNKWLNEKEDQ